MKIGVFRNRIPVSYPLGLLETNTAQEIKCAYGGCKDAVGLKKLLVLMQTLWGKKLL